MLNVTPGPLEWDLIKTLKTSFSKGFVLPCVLSRPWPASLDFDLCSWSLPAGVAHQALCFVQRDWGPRGYQTPWVLPWTCPIWQSRSVLPVFVFLHPADWGVGSPAPGNHWSPDTMASPGAKCFL